MPTISTWPLELQGVLQGLSSAVESRLDAEGAGTGVGSASTVGIGENRGATEQLIFVAQPAGSEDDQLAAARTIIDRADRDVVFVVSDGFLGTEAVETGDAAISAALVSLARSMAVRPGAEARSNVVAVPACLFGASTVQRGPLHQKVELEDVAESVAFLLSPSGGYLNGQVLFVNRGRQLFSSLSS